MEQPTLVTERLILRPLELTDASVVQKLAGAREVAETTGNIPHPYLDGMAEEFISGRQAEFESGTNLALAVVTKADHSFCGVISLLSIDKEHQRAELGYWVGVPYWGHGYCTEAAMAIVHHGFTELSLNRVYARHFKTNQASGRVMQKIGMTYEGCQRQHVQKWDRFHDMENYGILAEDWLKDR